MAEKTKKNKPQRKTRTLVWKKENTLKGEVPNRPGIYRFYDKNGKQLYVGHARRLRHRVQSYIQKDCPKEHPTKPKLRPKIAKYKWKVMPLEDARKLERRTKDGNKHNHW